MSENNQWRVVPGWPEYEISQSGDVRRVKKACGATVGKIIRQQELKNGYLKVCLCRNANRKEFLTHRLVASAWIGDIPEGMDVCHKDGNRKHNHYLNLRIDTRKGNMADTVKHGTANRGERCGSNKYSRDKIIAFRSDVDAGMKVADASRKHGLPYGYAYAVANRVTWAWL